MMKKFALAVLLLCTLSALVWMGVKNSREFMILYPLAATGQQVHIHNGLRFVGIDDSIKVYAVVLNNPVENGGYADILILSACNSGSNVAVSVESARTRSGPLEIVTGNRLNVAMQSGRLFESAAYPKELTPRMQAYGCAPVKTENTIERDAMDPLQEKIVTLYQAYRAQDRAAVMENILTAGVPGMIDGGIFRLLLPEESADTPLLVTAKVNLKHHTLRFQLQKLD